MITRHKNRIPKGTTLIHRRGAKLLYTVILALYTTSVSGFANDLRRYGYSLIPAPQETTLTGKDIKLNESWKVIFGEDGDEIAMHRLISGASELLGLEFNGSGTGTVTLEIDPGIIGPRVNKKLAHQGYRLSISQDSIEITGFGEAGLFYGVQSFLQLMRPGRAGGFTMPEGIITDWPDLELRMVHWDTKHHQDRLEILKRFLDQTAYFKSNAILFEIEDKYEYPSHPVIGAPGAFTKTEMQELSAYALKRYIQIIPVIQAPSHMGYVLKHQEFAHLRADGMNYQACLCNEESIQLIFDMYQDMIDATPGMDYFFISTDELYYPGICEKCILEYNDFNRSKIWAGFVNRAEKWLTERDRLAMAYIMYPLLVEDITRLSSNLITPVRAVESKEWITSLNITGIKQFAYSPMQGNELLFPNYFRTTFRGKVLKGRLADAANTIPKTLQNQADLMGTFAAAWDDAGLHNETFWLGWATVTQYGWSIAQPSVEQSNADFMDAFYGYNSPVLLEAYQLLQEGARFYEDLWDHEISKERSAGYGSSKGKGIGVDRFDLTLKLPSLPSHGDLVMSPGFNITYSAKIKEASKLLDNNDRLITILQSSLTKVTRNRYNVEVLLSLAYLQRYTINTLLNLSAMEDLLLTASTGKLDFAGKLKYMYEAYKLASDILNEEDLMWTKFVEVWERSRFPKCQSIDGKDFVHVFDDVKDHFADRRLGLEYMLAPFERMELENWKYQLGIIIHDYALKKNVPVEGFAIERLED